MTVSLTDPHSGVTFTWPSEDDVCQFAHDGWDFLMDVDPTAPVVVCQVHGNPAVGTVYDVPFGEPIIGCCYSRGYVRYLAARTEPSQGDCGW